MSRFRWLAAFIAATVWMAALSGGCRRVAEPPHVAPTPVVHLLGYPASPSFYANERAGARMWVTDPSFGSGGAVGDDSHDDTAAIVAADAAAKAVNGMVYFPNPSVAYKVTSCITTQWAAHWRGDSANINGTILRYHGSAGGCLWQLQSAYCPGCSGSGASPEFGGAARALVENLTFDANGLANNALLQNATQYSRFVNVRAENATYACLRSPSTQQAITIGSITQNGGHTSPSGLSLAQYDPNFSNTHVVGSSPATVVLKVQTSGARGTATYQVSTNAGTTFYPLSGSGPVIGPTTNIPTFDGNGYQGILGIVATWPSGTYASGDTYTFNVTGTAAIYGDVGSPNGAVEYQSDNVYHCGSVFYSSSLSGQFSGGYYGAVAAGTVATTSGSQIIVGSGTSFTSELGNGQSRAAVLLSNGSTTAVYQAWVLDDTHLAVVHGEEPTTTASGLVYAIGYGGGYYEDGYTEGPFSKLYNVAAGLSTTCFSFGGGDGPRATDLDLISCGIFGVSIGDGQSNPTAGATFEHFHANSSTLIGGAVPYMLSPYSSGSIVDPAVFSVFAGSAAGGWSYKNQGHISQLTAGSGHEWMVIDDLTLQPTQINLTSAGQQIPAPSTASPLITFPGTTTAGNSSLVNLNPSAPYDLSATPVIPNAPEGTTLFLRNISPFGYLLTIDADAFSGSGIQIDGRYMTIGYNEIAKCVSRGVGWRCSMWFESTYGGGVSTAGNTGDGKHVVVTTNATPTNLYQFAVQAGSGIAPNGTCAAFDVIATNTSGIGSWLDNTACWTNGGTQVSFSIGTESGNGAGNLPPNGWAMTVTGNTAASAFVIGTGDSSGTPVTWTVVTHHRDPGY